MSAPPGLPLRFVAVVPVKGLARAKSRLASALDADARRRLVLGLLDRTLRVIAASGSVAATLVVGADDEVLALAEARGALAVREAMPGHNEAVDQGRDAALAQFPGAAVLVIAADLPLLTSDDVSALVTLAADPSVVAIAPDTRSSGTNALAGWGVRTLPFRFGVNSFPDHCSAVERVSGLGARLYRAPGTARDLDDPDDFAALRAFLPVPLATADRR